MISLFIIVSLAITVLTIFSISPVYGIAFITAFRTLFLLTTVPIGAYEYSAEGFITLMIICLGIIFLMQKGLKGMKGIVIMPFIIFILYCALTIFAAEDVANFSKKLARLIGYFFLYLMVVELSTREKNRKILSYAFIVSAIVTIFPGTYFYFISPDQYMKSLYSAEKGFSEVGIMSKNNFGFFCCYMVFFFIYLYEVSKSQLSKFLNFSMIIVGTAVLIISYTRAAWASFLAAFPALIFASQNKKKAMLLIIAVIIICASLSPIIYYGAYKEITEKKEYGFSSWQHRWSYAWPASIKAFQEKPIMGWGLGNNLYALSKSAKLKSTSHNDYLLILVETGIIGLSLYLWLLLSLFRRTLKGIRQADDDSSRSLSVCALAIFSAFLVGSVAEHLLQTPGATGYVITILAMAHGTVLGSERKREKAKIGGIINNRQLTTL
jgi:O-antigen ligase